MERAFYPSGSLLLRTILWNRGLRSTSEAEKFLSPRLSHFPTPYDCLKDLSEALKILLRAREHKDLVVIYGDYDVDGTTSTALLVRCLKELGFRVNYFIPHRVEDGYGLTKKGAEKMLQKFPDTAVVVTCDNGIAAFEGVEFLKGEDIQVIVTDHHEVPSKRVSADAVINPKQVDCQYPEKRLAGVGVAFLLVLGLRRALNAEDFSLNRFLDLVALGTVCDVAPLLGGNRVLVKAGLKRMLTSEFRGLRVLALRSPGAASELKARDLGFYIGPRMNASGRIGDPEAGVRALLAETEAEAIEICDRLEVQNTERRRMQDQQLEQALLEVERDLMKNPGRLGLTVANAEFHLGIVGLVAGRLSEKFQRPSCVMTKIVDEHELAYHQNAESLWKGSLRAPVGFHLSAALETIRKQRPELLVSGGGHAQAAGVAIEEKNLEEFKRLFNEVLATQERTATGPLVDGDLTHIDELNGILGLLEPFGQGNPPPLISVRGLEFRSMRRMKDIHLKFWGSKSGKELSILQFQSPWVTMMETWGGGARVLLDVVGEISENTWNGKTSTELLLKDILKVEIEGRVEDVRKWRSENSNALFESKSVS